MDSKASTICTIALWCLLAAGGWAQPVSVFVEVKPYDDTLAQPWTDWLGRQLPQEQCLAVADKAVGNLLVQAKFDYRKDELSQDLRDDLAWENIHYLLLAGIRQQQAGRFSLFCRLIPVRGGGQPQSVTIDKAGEAEIKGRLSQFIAHIQWRAKQTADAQAEKIGAEATTPPARLASLQKAVSDAIAAKDYKRLAQLHEQIIACYDTMPEWAIRKQEQADRLPPTAQAQEALAAINRLNNLGVQKSNEIRYQEAEKHLEQALSLAASNLGQAHAKTLTVAINLAACYYFQGHFDKAKDLYEQTLIRLQQNLGDNHPRTLSARKNLAILYDSQGEYGKARELLEQTVRMCHAVLGARHPVTFAVTNSLAMTIKHQGNFGQARPLYEETIAGQRALLGAQHPDTLLTLNNLGALLDYQGEFDKAQACYNEALAGQKQVLGPRHPETLKTVTNIGSLYAARKRYETAEPFQQEAFFGYQATLGEKHPYTLIAQGNLALTCCQLKKYERAAELYRQAMPLYRQVFGERHPDTLFVLSNFGSLYHDLGQLDDARQLYQASWQGLQEVVGALHPHSLMALQKLALCCQQQRMWEQAESLWQQSFLLTNQFVQREMWLASEETRQVYLQEDEQNFHNNNLLSFYCQLNTASAARQALHFSLARKGVLLQLTADMQAVSRAEQNPALRTLAASLKKKRRELAGWTVAGPGKESAALFKQRLRATEEEIQALQVKLGQASEKFRRHAVAVTPEQLLEKLPADAVLFDFMAFRGVDLVQRRRYLEDRLAVVVAVGGASPVVRLVELGPLEPVRDLIRQYRATVSSGGHAPGNLDKLAKALYEKLWQPLAVYAQDKKCVYLVPDGVLHLLPFAALVDAKGRYLIESVPLVTLASSRDLVLETLPGQGSQAVIFAAPDYDKQSGNDAVIAGGPRAVTGGRAWSELYFTYLPGTAREGIEIARALRSRRIESVVYAKEQALESHMYRLSTPRILHIATHGFFLDRNSETSAEVPDSNRQTAGTAQAPAQISASDNPLLRSGLAFVGANQGVKGKRQADGTDGILTAYEVLSLDLQGTGLVVLSACETGVGEIRQGEGVYSLHRAFQEAGARVVVFTLWPTDDRATQTFMGKFYARYLAGNTAHHALRETQQEFIRSASSKFDQPMYWAQFVCVGR